MLGPADSARYVADAGGEVVPPDEAFDVLVIGDESGFPFLDWADAALSSLFVSIDRGRPVHLVVPNPDLIYPGGGGFGFAAGTIANMFEGALALRYPDRPELRFARLGKPNTPIFEDAIRRLGTSRAVMVGDTLETDIAGARAAGLDAVWIETGVTSIIPRMHRRTCGRRGGWRAWRRSRRRARHDGRRAGAADWAGSRGPRGAPSDRTPIGGGDVVLVPIDVAAHGPSLYALSHGPGREALWMYLWDGPYPSEAAFLENLAQKAVSEDPFFYSIVERASGRAVGVASYLRITPKDRAIEVGSIFTPALQRTRGATEAMYLMARHAFDTLGYRRYEWKCNALNAPSRRAAVRLGFQFEGIFRQHMIVKGRSRDTAWFAMIDRDWPAIRAVRRVARSRQLRCGRAAADAAADAVNRRPGRLAPLAVSVRGGRTRPPASRVGFRLDARPFAAFPREAPGAGRRTRPTSAGRKHARQVPPAWRTLG